MQPVKKTLIVDDDPVQLSVVEAWLSSAGCEVITHGSPIGTTQVVLERQPQILLVDWDMPILAGPELVELLIKRVTFELKFIFYSGKAESALNELVSNARPNVLGAIRKTQDGELFLSRFFRLLDASASRLRPTETKPSAPAPVERRASPRIRPAETDPVHVWVITPKAEFRLLVEDFSLCTSQASGGMRLQVLDPGARLALASPGSRFSASVTLPTERLPIDIRLKVERASAERSAQDSLTWLTVTYQVVDSADEARFRGYFVKQQGESGVDRSPISAHERGKSAAPGNYLTIS